jgi:hypothetical protein
MANSHKTNKAHPSKKPSSDKTAQEADSISKGIQKPGQTKDQTKLISQGIQKGIDIYKKQQKSKARELDKLLKKAKQPAPDQHDPDNTADTSDQNSGLQILPWGLLLISWAGFIAYLYLVK